MRLAASQNIGAISIGGNATIIGCSVVSSRSEAFSGAIAIFSTGAATVIGSTIANSSSASDPANSAQLGGGAGAIFMEGFDNTGRISIATFRNCTIVDSSAHVGGAMWLEGSMTFSDCFIAQSSASTVRAPPPSMLPSPT